MADPYDVEIRVAYNYIVRQRGDWLSLAPDTGKIAGLVKNLQWRGEPHTGSASAQSRPVTYLRPILAAHQRIVDWVGARADEGAAAQLHIAERLSEIVALYETNTETHERLLRTITP
jgi:hypothetical protein